MIVGEPQVHERAEQHYACVHEHVTMASLATAIDSDMPRVFGWLAQRGVQPAKAPFVRYLTFQADRQMEIEIGVPIGRDDAARVGAQAHGHHRGGGTHNDADVHVDLLPGGRYVTLTHRGHYEGLVAANAALQDWARAHDLEFDRTSWPDGESWAARLEIYTTNPAAEPDPAKWSTEVTYLLADG
jgi:hypothetical protein